MIRIKQATAKGWIECREGGGGGLKLPYFKDKKRKSARGWEYLPNNNSSGRSIVQNE